ncbi:PH domain-containing protein [Rothia kristinae]|uniref:PH domain-containing protein n=1 Tax=Rothia kristinae TaxID=37923 RepID=UPI0024477B83|nr:PH domain-containing protein [Rothia kristinae]WGH10016.1 PH domain-containing protein [Rothia kristinae]
MATRYLREEGATLRSRPMLVLVVLVELVLAGLLVSVTVHDGAAAGLRAFGSCAFLGYLIWWFLAWPHLRLDQEEITVVNPVRTHRLGYADLIDVQTRYGLHLVTRHRRIQAVGAPAGGAATAVWGQRTAHMPDDPHLGFRGEGASLMPSDLRSTASGRAAEVIRGHWQEQVEAGALRDEAEPVSTANTTQLVILAVLAAAAAAGLLL